MQHEPFHTIQMILIIMLKCCCCLTNTPKHTDINMYCQFVTTMLVRTVGNILRVYVQMKLSLENQMLQKQNQVHLAYKAMEDSVLPS